MTDTEQKKAPTAEAVRFSGERHKSASQRAEDMAYTINHALSCTATDFIDPFISAQTQKYLRRRVTLGCGGEHDTTMQNVIGEFAGDFGAVPFTVGVQHFFPGVMDAIRWVAEPVMGDMFRHGAKSAARHKMLEATMRGYPISKETYQNHARELYNYEIQHLPQGLTWTVSAIAFNVGIQKYILKAEEPISHILTGKVNGAIVSAGLLFGIRSFATEKAKHWDHWATKNVFLPVTKRVGSWVGVKEEDVKNLVDKQERLEAEANGHPYHPLTADPAPKVTLSPKDETPKVEEQPRDPHTKVSGVETKGRAAETEQGVAVA